MEDYFFSTVEENTQEKKAYVLIIYDIVDNAKRVRLAKFLQGYGFRVQKSAFEALISFSLYNKLLREIGVYVDEEDSIRIYKIVGQGIIFTDWRFRPDKKFSRRFHVTYMQILSAG